MIIPSLEQATHWHLALPSMKETAEPILPIIVNNITFGIPLSQVQYVDHVGDLTLFPLTSSPIEGLMQFNNLPLIQLNVAQALGFESKSAGKLVIVRLPQGYLALRVDEVLGFVHSQGKADEMESTQQIPLLKLTEIFPWIRVNHNAPLVEFSPKVDKKIKQNKELNNYILLVSSGDYTIGLLADSVDRIEGIDESLLLRKFDTDADLLVRIEDVLLPARSLGTLLGVKSKEERQAILIRGMDKTSVLAVERVSRLEKIEHFHLTASPIGHKSLWHLTEDKKSIEIVNAREFFCKPQEYNKLSIVNPQSRWDNLPQLAAKLSTEGVRVQCGNVICVLPLIIVDRILGDLEKEDLALADSDDTEETDSNNVDSIMQKCATDKIPVIDCAALFGQKRCSDAVDSYVLLSLQCGYVLIVVHRAELQPTLPDNQWFPLTFMPPMATLLFDTVAFSNTENQWIFRVKQQLDFSTFPWHIKRLFVSSLLKWVRFSQNELIVDVDQNVAT